MPEQHSETIDSRILAPPETGAVVPPHPMIYDITVDETRPVSQEDVDQLVKYSEEGGLRTQLIRRLLGWDRDKLRQLRKLIDDNFPSR